MNLRKQVVLTTNFTAVHCWPECPIETVSFLRTPHRHVFHVTMKFPISHNDRDIEFINHKDVVQAYIRDELDGRDLGRMSCEMIAEKLLRDFCASFVSVYEDNENGAEVFLAD